MTPSHTIRLLDPTRSERTFDIQPDAEARAALAGEIGVDALRKLRFGGRLRPEGSRDWHLEATLGATLVQPCGVTAAPVVTRIDERIERRYLAEMTEPAPGTETEMPEDTDREPLPAVLDLWAVMIEAMVLAVPPFPRAEGAEMGEAVFAAPGVAPMRDEDARPFAGLKDALRRDDDS